MDLCRLSRIRYGYRIVITYAFKEKMEMFLMVLGHDMRNAIVKRRFDHLLQVIHLFP